MGLIPAVTRASIGRLKLFLRCEFESTPPPFPSPQNVHDHSDSADSDDEEDDDDYQVTYNPGQKCWDTCTFSLKIAPLRFPPPPSPSQCCISGLKVHFFGATLTRGEGGRHFAQTRPSRASKTEGLANTCHIFRLSQGLLSRIVDGDDGNDDGNRCWWRRWQWKTEEI